MCLAKLLVVKVLAAKFLSIHPRTSDPLEATSCDHFNHQNIATRSVRVVGDTVISKPSRDPQQQLITAMVATTQIPKKRGSM